MKKYIQWGILSNGGIVLKKRFLYLDIARFWAVFLVILYHSDFHMTNHDISSYYSFTIQNNNYTGVVLFILLSGLSLTLNLKKEDKIDWKVFYKKRILGVLPLLWITYVLQYFRLFYLNGTTPIIGDKWRIIFSVLGLDGYLSQITTTFYLGVGEWFIGMILILYLFFPFLLYVLRKNAVIFSIMAVLIYIFSAFLIDSTGFRSILDMMPLFALGMLLGYHNPEIKLKSFSVLFVLFIFFQLFYIPPLWTGTSAVSDIIVSLTGLLCLKYLCQFITFSPIEKIFKRLSQMSYGMTLVNQQVIAFFAAMFSGKFLGNLDMFSLYTLIILTIYLLSVLLNYIQTQIFKYFIIK